MELFRIILLSLLLTTLFTEIDSRKKNRSSRNINGKRKGRNGPRVKKGHRKRKSLVTSTDMTTDMPPLLPDDILRLKTQYIDEFLRRRAADLGSPDVDDVKRERTNLYTEAFVYARFSNNSSKENLRDVRLHGKFGLHSPLKNIHGTLIHVKDRGLKHSHFGCAGKLSNRREIRTVNGPWIALIARGKCKFFDKIKLAEKYGASAVIVYDTEPRDDVDIMRTIGTKITALMINSSVGEGLVKEIKTNGPLAVNISVGLIRIGESDFPESSDTGSYTEAVVDYYFNKTKHTKGVINIAPHRTIGRFGRHSMKTEIYGRVVHIRDGGSTDTHYGCSGSIANHDEISFINEKWIALIAGGFCDDDVKIKLAEKYSASAVVVYDTELSDTPAIMNTMGSKITALMVNMRDGKAAVELIEDGHIMHMNITVGPTILEDASPGGHGIRTSSSNICVFMTLFLTHLTYFVLH